MTIKDKDKLVIIAQAYFYLKGAFTSKDISTFIKTNDFGFRSDPTITQIGALISRSRKFEVIEVNRNANVYGVKGK